MVIIQKILNNESDRMSTYALGYIRTEWLPENLTEETSK